MSVRYTQVAVTALLEKCLRLIQDSTTTISELRLETEHFLKHNELELAADCIISILEQEALGHALVNREATECVEAAVALMGR